jgi:hypothetical protein
MKIGSIKMLIITGLITGSLVSCQKKLNLTPNDQVTSAQVYSTAAGYKQALAKVYGSMALTGNQGPSGNPDLPIGDEGQNVDFFRTFWCAQELTTDEAVTNWGDAGLADFHNLNWTSSNNFLKGLYYRSLYQITLCNDFIRQSSDANLASRNISGSDATEIRYYKAEARYLRAFQYWVLMDLFANPPFVTENDIIGAKLPPQTDRKTLFTYVESELKALDGLLKAPTKNEYGRADQAADWALLARLYLNAQVYTGTAHYNDAITYSQKVINVGYTLIGNYDNLMLADNDKNTSEFIWTINYDGLNTQSYGGTTFLTHCQVGGTMPAGDFGLSGGWGGMRTTSALSQLFPANPNKTFPNNGNPDTRAEFWTDQQTQNITDVTSFAGGGYGVNKFRNVKTDGTDGKSLSYSDVDFPVFRLAEMYLIYAESVVRGGSGGDAGTALQYVNKLRSRAYGDINSTKGNITAGSLTTDFILDERGRELYWEGFRRTDLIRYGYFTAVNSNSRSSWPWKGGISTGTGVGDFRNVFPLPADDLTANPNLKQNSGYN